MRKKQYLSAKERRQERRLGLETDYKRRRQQQMGLPMIILLLLILFAVAIVIFHPDLGKKQNFSSKTESIQVEQEGENYETKNGLQKESKEIK